jgi:hypothetical protein
LDPRTQGTVKIKENGSVRPWVPNLSFLLINYLKEKNSKRFHLGSGGKQKECNNC